MSDTAIDPASSVMIHVRFASDGTVTEIGERPADKSAQEWFNHLSSAAGKNFEALSGGRGVFRLARPELDRIKIATTH
jgi:hypothetical protein